VSAGAANGHGDLARVAPWHPQAVALWDHRQGVRGGVIEVVDHTGDVDPVPVAHFFREGSQLDACDRAALDAASGRALDVGAAAGHDVTALEVEPHVVTLLRARGLTDVRLGTLADVHDGPFDTILLLMHGAGLGGDLDGLASLLARCRALLVPGGQVLVDSRDPGEDGAAVAELHLAYRGLVGRPFEWLFVSAAVLAEVARAAGLAAELLWQDDDGHHLQALRPR